MIATSTNPIAFAPAPPLPLTIGGAEITIAPAIVASLRAFRLALPALLDTRSEARQWVAFGGDQCIAFGKSKTATFQECLQKGWKRGTFIVRSIEPELPDELEVPNDL